MAITPLSFLDHTVKPNSPENQMVEMFFNEDCIEGCKAHIPGNFVDLIITDPPYGIGGDGLHKHYNRKEEFVIDGYIEVPAVEYPRFSCEWIREAHRILRPGGSIYIVSGYTHLRHILNALAETPLIERNHLIWKYNFGVFTRNKYVSSHYHILYYTKPGGQVTFNTSCRFGLDEVAENGGSRNYQDREDVWVINREYKPGKAKNKNELPTELLTRLIQYSSHEGDLVFDLFLGSFSTAKTAIGLGRRAGGFEKSTYAFSHQIREIHKITPGCLLSALKVPVEKTVENRGKAWDEEDKQILLHRYCVLMSEGNTRKRTVEVLGEEFGRGRWSIIKVLNKILLPDAE